MSNPFSIYRILKHQRKTEASKYRIQALEQELKLQKQVLENAKQEYGTRKHTSIADSLNKIGRIVKKLGNSAEAIEYYEQALEMLQELYRKFPTDSLMPGTIGTTRHNLWRARAKAKSCILH